jgi:hypothetical protein
LVQGLRAHGGKLLLNSPVASVLKGANGAARGVVLKNGAQITARQAVVSNASLWDTQKLIPQQAQLPDFAHQVRPSRRVAGGVTRIQGTLLSSNPVTDVLAHAKQYSGRCAWSSQVLLSQEATVTLVLYGTCAATLGTEMSNSTTEWGAFLTVAVQAGLGTQGPMMLPGIHP